MDKAHIDKVLNQFADAAARYKYEYQLADDPDEKDALRSYYHRARAAVLALIIRDGDG